MALRRRGMEVVGVDRSRDAAASALRRGAASRSGTSIAGGIRGAGTVFICVPLQAMAKVLAEVGSNAGAGAVISDAGSVKAPVIAMARNILPNPARFVGGHPMAGSEKSGSAAASPSMFQGRTVVLTPVAGTDPRAVATVAGLWRKTGARVVNMPPRRHDEAVAMVSHLPHAVAAALVLAARNDRAALGLAAGGFMDGTRVSLGNPVLWEGIFGSNRQAILSAIAGFERELGAIRRSISSRHGSSLRKLLANARTARIKIRRDDR